MSSKQEKHDAKDALEDLLGYGDEDEDTLVAARSLMRSFIYKAHKKMEEQGISLEKMAEDIDVKTSVLEDILNLEIFPDWVTFVKMKRYLGIPVLFHEF